MGLRSGIRKKPIPDPGSRGQKGTGSRIRIRNTVGKQVNVVEGFFKFFTLLVPVSRLESAPIVY